MISLKVKSGLEFNPSEIPLHPPKKMKYETFLQSWLPCVTVFMVYWVVTFKSDVACPCMFLY